MENEHELSYETLTRVYLGSYEHYKGVVAKVEHSKPGFELQGAKMVEMGDQGRGQGNGRNQNGDAINENIRGDVRNVIKNNDHRGCTYKEFLSCNPKECDGKGGVIVYTHWIEKMESIHTRGREVAIGMSWEDFKTLTREEFCPSNEMQKLETELWNHAMSWLGMVAATEPTTVQKAMQIAGTLTDESLRNESIKKNPKKRGNGGEPSKDRNRRDNNKRTRTGNAFATTVNPVRREYMGTAPNAASEKVYAAGLQLLEDLLLPKG
ncbi:hypothetical protein Tco_0038045 [Tanacetum coccineum]